METTKLYKHLLFNGHKKQFQMDSTYLDPTIYQLVFKKLNRADIALLGALLNTQTVVEELTAKGVSNGLLTGGPTKV